MLLRGRDNILIGNKMPENRKVHRRKAQVSKAILLVGVIMISILLMYFVLERAGRPTAEIYSNEMAFIQAQTIASNINELSTADAGTINLNLRGFWDIELKETVDGPNIFLVEARHEGFSSSAVDQVIVFADIDKDWRKVENAQRLTLIRVVGDRIAMVGG